MQIATVLLVLSGRRRARMFNPDIAVVMSIAMVITVLGYFVANPSAASPDYSAGLGVFVALVGGLVSTVAGVVWIRSAPYGRTPAAPAANWCVADCRCKLRNRHRSRLDGVNVATR